MTHHRLGMAAWLAENDGIPIAVQHMFNMAEYEARADEIESMRDERE
jgi:hypothetical protein